MNKNTYSFDFIIIGAGVIGLCIGLELKRRLPHCRLAILEKENQVAYHASGRNSGVLHAGFYYSSDSLKARFTKEGNSALTAYCEEKKLPILRCGKLVVTKNATELSGLEELVRRGEENNIELQVISDIEAKKIEPRVLTYEKAIYSPTTSSVSPSLIMQELLKDAQSLGIEVYLNTKYLNTSGLNIQTTQGSFSCEHLINAAGLYADKIAKDFGFAKDYRILPFKGIYLSAEQNKEKLNTHIYPVPDLKYPFLGVHLTKTIDGKTKIGPTAIPAFWREHYKGLSRFKLDESIDILLQELGLLFHSNFNFRQLALNEMKKYNHSFLIKLANELASSINPKDFLQTGQVGIRAQLLNIKKRKLEMDFLVEGDKQSTHVLNAVSPAFTCSIPFSNYIVTQLIGKLDS